VDTRSLAAEVRARYGLGRLPEPERLIGGYANDVYRLGDVVARVAPEAATEETLAYEHRLVTALAERVPEVKAPLRALDGSTFWTSGGRLISLWPWIPGRRGERRSRRLRLTAAAVLARIHNAGLELGTVPPRPAQPSLRDLDWRSNWMWELEAALSVAPRRGLEEAWHETAELLRTWRAADLAFGPIHSDYFPGNVIAVRGSVIGVIDWDYAKPDWLVWELGRSLWEFAKDKRRHYLKPERAGEFLAAYRAAGGPLPREEERLLVPMIRCVRLEEAMRHLTDAAYGRPWDAFYTTHNLRSYENLRRASADAPERWLAAAALA
jgi:Ser/Thr protein kinase RdoA (MazF antagonist)